MKKNIHTNKKEFTTYINFILDKSGSMEDCLEGTIGGFNNYVRDLKKKGGDIRFSLTLFDNVSIDKLYVNTPIKNVDLLNTSTYRPNGGTPLYDAAVDAIEEASEYIKRLEKKPLVITVIMTDGMENASKRHDQSCLRDIQEKLTKEGNWTFVFLGANQDSYSTASNIGTPVANAGNFQASNAGSVFAMSSLSRGTETLMKSAQTTGVLRSANFFAGIETEVK